ncbi:uncharacterized protein GIQ15_00509 [Arthroderma uncinatum]|uniref:uncharacterized protein n=1 Tax=Arthroderma uncinatum TaxID=74035 RepID=UPI00144AE344|nr:uncharacterized protein GIQ15_00509 [Arthroderma uncinatum]KAF3490992.1 hypothetical protein GIQ15_00509 [Arthroderma uncinatum]
MSLLRNLNAMDIFDAPSSVSCDGSGNSDTEEVEESSIQGDGLNIAKAPTPFDPATDPAYSLINGKYVRIGPRNVEFPDREGPNPRRSNSKSPHPRYPTPNGTPVYENNAVPTSHANGTEEEAARFNAQNEDMLKNNFIDPSLITTPTDLFMNSPLITSANDPTQISTPAATLPSSPVPGPGGLKPKAPAKGKRGAGSKKQAPTRPARTAKAKTGGKKAGGTGSGTGSGMGKGKGKGTGGKGRGETI